MVIGQSARSTEKNRNSIKSVQKALTVLNVVGEATVPPRIAEVAAQAGISRPTAYRIAQELIAEGYLEQDAQSGRLLIGYSVLTLSSSLLDHNRLRLEALPHLQSLATTAEERVNLGILHRSRVLYIAGIEKPSLPTIYSRFGHVAPAHCCSLGKAILAYLGADDVQAIVAAEPLIAHTPNSITSFPRLKEELEATKKLGYAIDREEHMIGSFCIAAPIFDSGNRPVAAIGISGRSLEPLLKHMPVLRHTAEVISHVL
jgi:IclR family acetate operon transcriptional repressor